jgi:DNA polymerase III delta' subunit
VILGHERVVEGLWRALAEERPHHAYLFEGPRGVGKRTVAELLAQAANCERVPPGQGTPCGTCLTCRQIANGTHPDVIRLLPDEERAARAIPVDRVREVIRQLAYHRFSARRRFVIVDPAEAMLEAAQNAILKTLEEPPEGTHFVLVTHNAAVLLPTIRSRCQRVRFGSVPEARVRDWLVAVVGRPPDVAAAAARASLGSPGVARDLDAEALAERTERRDALVRALHTGGEALGELATKLTSGARTEWAPGVDRMLFLVEEVVRDAILHATGVRETPPDGPGAEVVHALAARFPDGPARCAQAITDARDDLEVFVSGKTAIDALLAGIRREIAP